MPDGYATPSVGPQICHTTRVRVVAKYEDNIV